MLLTTVKLAAAKSTRVLVYVLLGLLFNIGEQTDEFFLAYSLATFSATIAVSTESYFIKQNKSMLGVFVVGLAPIVLALALAISLVSSSILVFLFLPYIILSTLASLYTGVVNKEERYKITLISSSSYLLILPIIFLGKMLDSSYTLELIILLLTLPELMRLILLIKLSKAPLELIQGLKSLNKTLFLILLVPITASIAIVIERLIITSVFPLGAVSIWAYSFSSIGAIAGLINYGRTISLLNENRNSIVNLSSLVRPLKLGVGMILIILIPVVLFTYIPLNLNTKYLSLDLANSINLILPLLVIASLTLPLKYIAASLVVQLIKNSSYKQLLFSLLVGTSLRLVLIILLSPISLKAVAGGVVCSELVQLVILYYYTRERYTSQQSYSSS